MLASNCAQTPHELIGFGDDDAENPHNLFVGFGGNDAQNPYEFIGFGDDDAHSPYEFIGFGDDDAHNPYEFIGFGDDDAHTVKTRSEIRPPLTRVSWRSTDFLVFSQVFLFFLFIIIDFAGLEGRVIYRHVLLTESRLYS